METKRDFLKKLSLLTAGGLMAGSVAPACTSTNTSDDSASVGNTADKKVGLQIYSLGQELTSDVPAGMKKIKDIGYSYIELAGYRDRKMGDYELSEYRKIVEDAGLKITSSHVSYRAPEPYNESMLTDIEDFWKQTVEDHVTLGCETLVQPSMPVFESPDDVKFAADIFNKAGQIAKDAGIRWGYHNHNQEFGRVLTEEEKKAAETASRWNQPGTVIYDLLLENTDPELVLFEMDVYWCVQGQNDPLDYFEKYAGRFPILHIKDRFVLGASGLMNFENIFNKAQENGLERFYVELESRYSGGKPQFEGVEASYNFLNNSSFVK